MFTSFRIVFLLLNTFTRMGGAFLFWGYKGKRGSAVLRPVANHPEI